MRKQRVWKYLRVLPVVGLLVVTGAGTALAQSSSSNNYQIVETEFGGTSADQSCTSEYCSVVSIGDPVDGEASGNESVIAFPDIVDPNTPLLEVIVNSGVSNMGAMSLQQTGTRTMELGVRSYLSDGYFIQIAGDAPTYDGHSIATPETPTASTPGTEQFGMNVVANTTPAIGADPVQEPSGEFSFGYVADDYNTPDLFMYTPGAVVAQSDTESGQTNYTISMIVNISSSTPAGRYVSDFSAVIVPAF